MQTFKEFLKENTNEEMDFTEVMLIYHEGVGKSLEGKLESNEKFDKEDRDFYEEVFKAIPILNDICYYKLGREEIEKSGMSYDEWEREEIIRLYSPSSDPVHTFLVNTIKALYFDTITRPDSADIEFCEENLPRVKMLLEKFWKEYYIAVHDKDRSKLDLCKKIKKYFEDAFWFTLDAFGASKKYKERIPN